jgi:hypothetical protein
MEFCIQEQGSEAGGFKEQKSDDEMAYLMIYCICAIQRGLHSNFYYLSTNVYGATMFLAHLA